MTALAPTLEAFFTDRLLRQRQASPHTIAAYRDTWRLLLAFATQQAGKQPCQLDLSDLDAPLIGAFLNYLEHERGNSARTRNARLAAICSLFRYAALRHPEHAALIARVLAIPPAAATGDCAAESPAFPRLRVHPDDPARLRATDAPRDQPRELLSSRRLWWSTRQTMHHRNSRNTRVLRRSLESALPVWLPKLVSAANVRYLGRLTVAALPRRPGPDAPAQASTPTCGEF